MRWMCAVLVFLTVSSAYAVDERFPRPRTDWNPRVYYCKQATSTINVDGIADEADWQGAATDSNFADIEGDTRPKPGFATTLRLLWDADYLYVYAYLEEPQLQASFTERDSFIYQLDNDFEVFIDPDGDCHNYLEIELNAFNTVWDLLLTRPYRDGGKALHGFDVPGLETAVRLDGTINDSSDLDHGWGIELAIPWEVFPQFTDAACPPETNDYWRLNFSRVQWQFESDGSNYTKKIDPDTSSPFAENNWVWSPQGLIAMHYPEMWGYVVFTCDSSSEVPLLNPVSLEVEQAGWLLYQLYYGQHDYHQDTGQYADNPGDLGMNADNIPQKWVIQVDASASQYIATIHTASGDLASINQDGLLKTWRNQPE